MVTGRPGSNPGVRFEFRAVLVTLGGGEREKDKKKGGGGVYGEAVQLAPLVQLLPAHLRDSQHLQQGSRDSGSGAAGLNNRRFQWHNVLLK